MNISRFIVKARRSLGLSQKGLADVLGVSQGSVSKWEAGKESPRAETVERIRELSGIKVQEPEAQEEIDSSFSTFCEVPYKGSFIDGLPYSPFNAGSFKTLMLYLSKSVAEQRLEAWAVTGMYDSLPHSFVGVFSVIDEVDRQEITGHPVKVSRVLTRSASADGTVTLSIEEVNGNDRTGYWLWPLDRRTRSRTLPAKVTGEERPAGEPNTYPYATLVAVIYEPNQHRQRSI